MKGFAYMLRIIKLLLLYFGYQLLFVSCLMALAQYVYLEPVAVQAYSLLLSGIAMSIHLIMARYVSPAVFRVPAGLASVVLGVGCIFGTMVCCNALSELIQLPDWLSSDFEAMSRSVAGILAMVVMAPWVEELLFRGAIQQHLLSQGRSPRSAILLSAICFGVIHINPAQVLFAFLMGIALGWVVWRTGSIIPAIAGHLLNNGMSVVELRLYGAEGMPAYSVPALLGIAVAGLLLAIFLGWMLNRSIPPVLSEQINN